MNTYVKEQLINRSSHFEVPDSVVIEPHFLFFIDESGIIRGTISLKNKNKSN